MRRVPSQLFVLPAVALFATFGTSMFIRAASTQPAGAGGPTLRVVYTGDNTGEIEPCG